MTNPIIHDVVAIVMPLAIGFATVPITDFVKHGLTFIDKQPAAVKQGLTASVAALVTLLAKALETTLPTDLAVWDASTADALVSAVFAIALKHSAKITEVQTGLTGTHQAKP